MNGGSILIVCGMFTAFAALAGPAAAAAAESAPLSLEERVKRLEDLLGAEAQAGGAIRGRLAAAEEANAALRTRLAAAESANTALRTRIAAVAEAGASLGPQIALTASAPPQTAPPQSVTPQSALAGPAWTYGNNRPVIRSPNEDFELAFRGRLQFDSGVFYQNSNLPPEVVVGRDLKNGANFRRAQFGIEGQVFRDFDYEFVFDFGSSGTERAGQIYLLRLAYTGIPNFTINAGAIQPKFTADDSTSSADITFAERASIVNTILDPFGGSDSRRGLELRYQRQNIFRGGDNILLSTAFTGERIAAPKNDDEGTQLVGRAAYRFFSNAKSNFQLGMNGARILNEPSGFMSFGDRPETRLDGTRLVGFGSGALPAAVGARTAWLWGLESAMNYGPFTLQGEYFRYGLERTDKALKDPMFDGWYVQGSYFLTGEMRPYNAASAAFGTPAAAPFQPGTEDRGAWEAKARYSVNDLNAYAYDPDPANRVRGGEQRILSLGLNWYPNRNVRMMFDYIIADIDRLDAAGMQAGQNFNVLAARMQFSF